MFQMDGSDHDYDFLKDAGQVNFNVPIDNCGDSAQYVYDIENASVTYVQQAAQNNLVPNGSTVRFNAASQADYANYLKQATVNVNISA